LPVIDNLLSFLAQLITSVEAVRHFGCIGINWLCRSEKQIFSFLLPHPTQLEISILPRIARSAVFLANFTQTPERGNFGRVGHSGELLRFFEERLARRLTGSGCLLSMGVGGAANLQN
jgi:hypothetical protein